MDTYQMNNGQVPLRTTYIYDGIGRLMTMADPAGNVMQRVYQAGTGLLDYIAYNDLGDPGRVRIVSYNSYDGLARNNAQVDAGESGSSLLVNFQVLDDADRPVISVDPEGIETRHAFDLLGREVAKVEAFGTPLQRVTASKYDRLGRLAELRTHDGSAEQVTTYAYDLVGRQTRVVYPDSSDPASDSVRFAYDRAGRRIQKTDQRGVVVEYAYDHRGLLTTRTVSNQSPAVSDSYHYDGLGRLTRVTRTQDEAEISESTFAYNDLSNKIAQSQKHFGSGSPKTVAHQYDQSGSRTGMTYPAEIGLQLSITLDPLNRVDRILRNGAEWLDYDYQGMFLDKRRIKTQTAPEAFVEYDVAYDEHRRMNQIVNRNIIDGTPSTLAGFDYTFDRVGNRLSTVGSGNPVHAHTVAYAHDALHRVTTATYSNGSETFDMDLLGNRNQYTDTRPGGDATFYGENNTANEYSTINDKTVIYDAAGNLQTDEAGFRYHYDFENRLVGVDHWDPGLHQQDPEQAPVHRDAAGVTLISKDELRETPETLKPGKEPEHVGSWIPLANYTYDALGRRIAATAADSGETVLYYYDDEQVVAEYDGSGSLLRYYIDGSQYIDEHVLMHDAASSTDHYYLHKELYSVAGLTDSTGAVEELYDYNTYGEAKVFSATAGSIPQSAFGNAYTFTGRRLDSLDAGSSTLHAMHYRARWYDPTHGRFGQRDPLTYVDGMNLYQYVASNPTVLLDPNGLKWEFENGKRDPSKPRATVIAGKNDNVITLANMVKLDPDEYTSWLKTKSQGGGQRIPSSKSKSVLPGCKYTVPNKFYVHQGANKWYAGGMGAFLEKVGFNRKGKGGYLPWDDPFLSEEMRDVRDDLNAQGYLTILKLDVSKAIVLQDLVDPDIHGWAMGGHAGLGSMSAIDGDIAPFHLESNVFDPHTRSFPSILHHKLGIIIHFGCFSHNPQWLRYVAEGGDYFSSKGNVYTLWQDWYDLYHQTGGQ